MHKDVKETKLTSTQLFVLSMQTCQWWKATLIQAKRFFDILENDRGGTPWDDGENNSMFIADRMFLITALHHAFECLEKLSFELQRENDETLKIVIDAINALVPIKNIKNLRHMNEHSLEYLAEKGYNQKHFQDTVKKGNYKFITTAAWTIVHGDAETILLGNVEIDKLILVMKEHFSVIESKTKEIFERELGVKYD